MYTLKSMLPLAVVLGLTACDLGPKSARGFRLPDGSPETGQKVFAELQCHSCHSVEGVELPPPTQVGPVSVQLGGPVTAIKTYGELVSSIINPSHRITHKYPADQVSVDGESKMWIYNEVMSVQQLIDLVAFLQDRYDVIVPDYHYRAL